MGLWIRSQDKRHLRKYNGIFLNYNYPSEIRGDLNVYEEAECNEVVLGVYGSDERALEVLDEIQKAIIENLEFKECSNKKVYQMPEK